MDILLDIVLETVRLPDIVSQSIIMLIGFDWSDSVQDIVHVQGALHCPRGTYISP